MIISHKENRYYYHICLVFKLIISYLFIYLHAFNRVQYKIKP